MSPLLDWKDFENKHSGERCFILGNAPNLIEEELSLLKGQIVFITNRGYMAKEHGLDHYDYHVVCDLLVYNDFHEEFKQQQEGTRVYPLWFKNLPTYQGENFLPVNYKVAVGEPYGAQKNGTSVLYHWPENLKKGWGKAGNAVLNATLVAYFMGFKEIYLLGVEMRYRKGETHFYKNTSKREDQVPDGHRSKGIEYIDHYTKQLTSRNIKWCNLSRGSPFKKNMLCDTLSNIIKTSE